MAYSPTSSPGRLAIDIADASKVYRGKVHALRGVALQVHPGEIFGLLGPNGAGKSTLVKILMTVIKPTTCKGTVLGRPVGDKATLRRVGYLPEHHKFPEYLTGWQVLDFYGALCGVAKAERAKRADELLDLVGLSNWQNTKVREYSKGMRQRCGIAQAMMNDPDLVILDEPTDGVDPVGRRDIRGVLLEAKRRGKSVVVNSHLLSELEMVSDRVAILVQGRVSSQGTIDELTRDGRWYEVEVVIASGANAETAAAEIAGLVAPLGMLSATAAGRAGTTADGTKITIEGGLVKLFTDDSGAVQPVIDALRRAAMTIKTVRQVRPTLEDLFMSAVVDPTSGRAFAPGAAGGGGGKGGEKGGAGGGAGGGVDGE